MDHSLVSLLSSSSAATSPFISIPSLSHLSTPNINTTTTMEDVVIVGAGLAGLSTALGLHRKGVRSLILESSESLRSAGFALMVWTNAWSVLDDLRVSDNLRQRHSRLEGLAFTTASSRGTITSKVAAKTEASRVDHEFRCVRRNMLVEALAKDLPHGTIRYSSKVVAIEEAGELKLLHLSDGTIIKTKVLIGCDGVNSVVAAWLGLKKPSYTGRSATRGFTEFPDGHGFNPEFMQFFGEGFRAGLLPCDERSIYWFFTWTVTPQNKEVEKSATKMRELILDKLKGANLPEEVIQVVEKSEITEVLSSPLRLRWPFELLWANISKGNVCVAGDALHPMTPDIGQGGCSSLEDGIVLARCLSEALLAEGDREGESLRIENALEKYAKERKWRSINLVTTSYIMGVIQEGNGHVTSFLRDKCQPGVMARTLLSRADFDCGKL